MMTLAIPAYAHHTEVKAYHLIASTIKRIARFAAPKTTIILIFEKKKANRRLQSRIRRQQPCCLWRD